MASGSKSPTSPLRCKLFVISPDMEIPSLPPVPESFAHLDEPLPLKYESGIRAWAESRAIPLGGFRSHIGVTGAQVTNFKVMRKKVHRLLVRQNHNVSVMKVHLKATASAWNRGSLRRRDRLDPEGATRRRRHLGVQAGKSHQGVHPAAWTASGSVLLAFRKIGSVAPGALRITSRELDAIGGVALAAVSHRRDATKTTMMEFAASGSPWLFVGRSHDCTPIKVRKHNDVHSQCRHVGPCWIRRPSVVLFVCCSLWLSIASGRPGAVPRTGESGEQCIGATVSTDVPPARHRKCKSFRCLLGPIWKSAGAGHLREVLASSESSCGGHLALVRGLQQGCE